jgi:hypothetical protein
MHPAGRKNVSSMSTEEKIAEALRRSLPHLPAEAREQVLALLTPASLTIIAGTLVVWAGSHFFGVGEVVDVILLLVGVVTIGGGVWQFGKELYGFATSVVNARTDQDLDEAGDHFARAVAIGGITAVSALLLHRGAKEVIARGRPTMRPGLLDPGPPPPGAGAIYKPTIRRPLTLPGGALGETDWYGNISVTRLQSLEEQKLTLYHEWVHSILSPRLRYLQQLRAGIRASGYWRSALLRYLEEAMAESYAQLRVRGIAHVWKGVTFPVGAPGLGYVTLSELAAEGRAVGNILLGGRNFTVYFMPGSPAPPE